MSFSNLLQTTKNHTFQHESYCRKKSIISPQVLVEELQKTIRTKRSSSIQRKEREIWHWVRYVLSHLVCLKHTQTSGTLRWYLILHFSIIWPLSLPFFCPLLFCLLLYGCVLPGITFLPPCLLFFPVFNKTLLFQFKLYAFGCSFTTSLIAKESDLKFLFYSTCLSCNFTFPTMHY